MTGGYEINIEALGKYYANVGKFVYWFTSILNILKHDDPPLYLAGRNYTWQGYRSKRLISAPGVGV